MGNAGGHLFRQPSDAGVKAPLPFDNTRLAFVDLAKRSRAGQQPPASGFEVGGFLRSWRPSEARVCLPQVGGLRSRSVPLGDKEQLSGV
jgi:hypothetical protein